MKTKRFALLSSMFAGLLLAGAAQATQLLLPPANAMSVGVYNDFNVYSLDLLKQCAAAGDPRCLPSGPFPVQSSPGQIGDQAVVLAGASGNQLNNTPSPFAPGSKVNDPYVTPSGSVGTFTMTGGGGSFAGDLANRWDISLSLLQTYLGVHDLVFLFDNNQQGADANQIINIWGQARIVTAAGVTVSCFEISLGTSGCSDMGNNPTPAPSDYLPVVGNFCVDKTTGAAFNIGTAQNAGSCPNGYFISNNLGTNIAEFAAFNQALNNAAKSAANSGNFLSLNIKYTGNNGGQEQLWICSECDIGSSTSVPEPDSLSLMLMAALVAGGASLKARRKHKSRA